MYSLSKNSFEMHSKSLIRAVAVSWVLFLPQTLLAQSSEPSVEEIVVTGERSLRTIKNQTIAAENELYDVFNAKYEGTDYEITCRMESLTKNGLDPTTNAWKVRVCRSKKAHELHEEAASAYADYYSDESSGLFGIEADMEEYDAEAMAHSQELKQKTHDLLMENPEYLEIFTKYAKLKLEYDAALKADREEGNFFTNLFSRDE